MSAYVIAMIKITDPEKFSRYSDRVVAICEKFGGLFLVRGGNATMLEGHLPHQRVAVLQFESREQAVKFYNSMEYQDAKTERMGASDFNMVVVDGVA
jgi:uncharacterized protein (DUF1330 family)